MIDYDKIETALFAWFDNLGLQGWARDKKEPNTRMEKRSGMPNDIIQAKASYKNSVSINPGWDEVREDVHDPDDDLMDQIVTGPRALVIAIQVKSITVNAAAHAYGLAERLRTRLRFPTIKELFKVAGIALAQTTDVVDVSFKDRNKRLIGMAAFDLRVNAAAAETDVVTDTIGTLLLTSDYKDEAGVSLPPANQLTSFPLVID